MILVGKNIINWEQKLKRVKKFPTVFLWLIKRSDGNSTKSKNNSNIKKCKNGKKSKKCKLTAQNNNGNL